MIWIIIFAFIIGGTILVAHMNAKGGFYSHKRLPHELPYWERQQIDVNAQPGDKTGYDNVKGPWSSHRHDPMYNDDDSTST